MRCPSDCEFRRGTHCGKVGSYVDRVCDKQEADKDEHEGLWKDIADIFGKAAPGNSPNLRADELDCRHQRIRQRHRPKHIEAELRTRLGIGGNAAWIVIRGASDEART